MIQAADALELSSGILVANPLPESAQLDPATHDRLLADALQAADAASVHGKDITPFLLDYIHRHTDGASVAINLEIVRSNCRLGADIARSWSAARRQRSLNGRLDIGPIPERPRAVLFCPLAIDDRRTFDWFGAPHGGCRRNAVLCRRTRGVRQ